MAVMLNVDAAELVVVESDKEQNKNQEKNDHEVDSYDYDKDENEKRKKKRHHFHSTGTELLRLAQASRELPVIRNFIAPFDHAHES